MNGYLVLCFVVATLTPGDLQTELEYATKLRELRLFRLAQLQCRQLLGRSDLESSTAARVTIELSKCLAAHALNSRPPQRDQLWSQAQSVLSDALRVETSAESKIPLQLQHALTTLMRAEFSRHAAEITARNDTDWQSARAQLRDAISQLKEVAREQRVPVNAGEASQGSTVRYQLARAYWNQALTYDSRSTDRINSLTLALEQLEPLATSIAIDPLVWQSRLDRIRCYRLLEQYDKAKQLIAEMQGNNGSAGLAGELAAESVRLALDQGDPNTAAKLINQLQTDSELLPATPELALARIEALVALSRQALDQDNKKASTQYREQATRLATSLADSHGTYWTLRGEMLIARLAERGAGQSDLDLLTAAARSYLRRDLPDDAAEMFIQAARHAEAAGNSDDAFQFRYQAAAVDHQRGHLQPAIDRLRDVALKYPNQAKAATAHLLGIFDAAELYRQNTRQGLEQGPQSLAQYRALLEEHLQHWPESETANQARLWLGRLLAATRQWDAAIEQYQAIELTSAQSLARYERLHETLAQVLDRAGAGQQLEDARAWFSRQVEAALATGASPQAQRSLLEMARLHMLYEPTDYLMADASLRRALELSDNSSADTPLIHALMAVAAAGRDQLGIAEKELSLAVPLPPRALAETLRGLQKVLDSRPNDDRLLDLIAEVAKLIVTYRDELSEDDQRLLEEASADVVSRSDPSRATAAYARLADTFPTHRRIQRRYAELLSLAQDRTSRDAALEQWRLVVRQCRPRTRDWFRGKLGVATAQYHLGNRRQAREIIELLKSLYPEMGGPELKRDFMRLLQRCET